MIEGLGPYPSLFLLALPAATVEPLKLIAVAVAGEGHWITGTAMIVACYAFSLLVVERLFVVVKPKLLASPQVILEGEALAYDPSTGAIQPFQVTSQRRRVHNIAERNEASTPTHSRTTP